MFKIYLDRPVSTAFLTSSAVENRLWSFRRAAALEFMLRIFMNFRRSIAELFYKIYLLVYLGRGTRSRNDALLFRVPTDHWVEHMIVLVVLESQNNSLKSTKNGKTCSATSACASAKALSHSQIALLQEGASSLQEILPLSVCLFWRLRAKRSVAQTCCRKYVTTTY